MNLFWISIISLSICWVQGCSSKKDTTKKEQAENYQADTNLVRPDTLPRPAPPLPGLPPGQAKVKGEIIALNNIDSSTTSGSITLKVDKVQGYGASTPSIATNDTIQVKSTISQRNEIQIGKIVSAVISYQLMLGDPNSSSRWTLVKLEKNSN